MSQWVRNKADIAHGPSEQMSMSRGGLLMRRYAIRYTLEFVVIFMGVLVSFSVQRLSEEKRQAQETEHLKQLCNMAMINEAILEEGRLDREFLIAQHNAHPFGHSDLDHGQWIAPAH